ncbi:MAG: glycosyltransferase family 2 protein [Planctomycetes bacterium]|nr:glycosyltransferase family 2 protein [Planctomycetota bacterium]
MQSALPTSTSNLPRNEVAADSDMPVALTVLLPAFNEEAALGPVVTEVRRVMAAIGSNYEILVVDDASTDGTAAQARALGARLVSRAQQGGSGASRKTGVLAARGEIILMMDADGTYDAEDFPKLLEHFPAWDQVNGARVSEEGTLKALRVPAKWMIRQVACLLAGRRIPDLNTGMKAFKREPMLRYLWVVPDGFSCVTSMTLAFLTNGHPVRWVRVNYRPRIGRSKFRPLRDGTRYLITVVRMITYFRPLRVFGPMALLLFVTSALKAAHDLQVVGAGLQESTIVLSVAALMVLVLGLLADLIVAQKRLS